MSPISSALPSPSPTAGLGNIAPVTKTSLAAKKQDGSHIGSGHNFSPKPFVSVNWLKKRRILGRNAKNDLTNVYSRVAAEWNGRRFDQIYS